MRNIPAFASPKKNVFTLRVSSYSDGRMSGYTTDLFTGETGRFDSFAGFLLRADEAMDDANFPQSALKKRGFGGVEPKHPGESCQAPEDCAASFEIRVLFRQNGSWQGDITWLERGEKCAFRSVLELLFILDSALNRELVPELEPRQV